MQAEKQPKETMTRTQRKTQLYLHNRVEDTSAAGFNGHR